MADSIDRVFAILSQYWSFFNYELLEHIINCKGTPNDIVNLEEYKEELKVFCRRRIDEVPKYALGQISASETTVQMKLDLDHPTLNGIRDVKQRICKILAVPPSTLHIYSTSDGCVELAVWMPTHIRKQLFPVTNKQQKLDLYHKAHIQRIQWFENQVSSNCYGYYVYENMEM